MDPRQEEKCIIDKKRIEDNEFVPTKKKSHTQDKEEESNNT